MESQIYTKSYDPDQQKTSKKHFILANAPERSFFVIPKLNKIILNVQHTYFFLMVDKFLSTKSTFKYPCETVLHNSQAYNLHKHHIDWLNLYV